MLCKICNNRLEVKYNNVSDINFKITKDLFDWYQCKTCFSLQIKAHKENENIEKYYDDYSPNKADFPIADKSTIKRRLKHGPTDKLSIAVDQINKFKNTKNFSLIDLGCGNGEVLFILRVLYPDSKLYGIDYNVKASKKNLSESSIELYQGDFDMVPKNIKFDFIISSQLLEHIDNPITYRDFLNNHSHADTVVVLDVPNINSNSFKIFGCYWTHLDTPRHRVHHTVQSILILFDSFELMEERVFGSNYVYKSSLKNKFNIIHRGGGCLTKLMERTLIKISELFLKADDKISFILVKK